MFFRLGRQCAKIYTIYTLTFVFAVRKINELVKTESYRSLLKVLLSMGGVLSGLFVAWHHRIDRYSYVDLFKKTLKKRNAEKYILLFVARTVEIGSALRYFCKTLYHIWYAETMSVEYLQKRYQSPCLLKLKAKGCTEIGYIQANRAKTLKNILLLSIIAIVLNFLMILRPAIYGQKNFDSPQPETNLVKKNKKALSNTPAPNAVDTSMQASTKPSSKNIV